MPAKVALPYPIPRPGSNAIREVKEIDHYVFEKNVDIPMKDGGLLRGNVWRPKGAEKSPVIMTYGPYGKDIPYADFHGRSFSQVPPEHKSEFSAWETPEPTWWTKHGYAILRVDERGIGASPGFLDTMSSQTASDFAEAIEWAAEQPWSTGKIGLLGISYFGGSQWRVAARKPKGLACCIPWEGMSDYYRDRCRHGGIYSNMFIRFWSENQVLPMQYGNAKKKPRAMGPGNFGPPVGPECIECEVPEEELKKLCSDQTVDNRNHQYLDEEYYASRVYKLSDIEVPTLSVANLGGNTMHLRGNVIGYLNAGTKNKWLWFISGRHDLPFYLPHFVDVQKSFLDAWLKGEDDRGWHEGPNAKVPAIKLLVRKGNPGTNSNEAEAHFKFRDEHEWPLARTKYTKFYLNPETKTLDNEKPNKEVQIKIEALGKGQPIHFSLKADKEFEIAGHSTANLVMSAEKRPDGTAPKEIDVFVTLRHLDADGKEIFYTGTAGDPVPLCKGWLRASLRAVNDKSPEHRDWLPYREYRSTDVQPIEPDVKYDLLIEVWPTQVVVEKGNTLVFEIATGDTQGCGIFKHDDPVDRSEEKLAGTNVLHFGPEHENWLTLPIV